MDRRRKGRVALIGLGVLGVIVLIGVFVVFKYFTPVATTEVDQPLQDAEGWTEGLPVLATGQFVSADGAHEVSGTVSVYRGTKGLILRFENYQATSGPKVYIFSSSSPEGDFDAAWSNYVRLAGGAEDGMASLRGNFNATLDPGIELHELGSLIVRCERFEVTFGSAPISPVETTGH